MSSSTPMPMSVASRAEQAFPTLTREQISRVAAHGQKRSLKEGEVVVEAGKKHDSFFVVISGELRVVLPGADGGSEELIAEHKPGQFTGETNLLSGRRGLVNVLAVKPSEVIELGRSELIELVQTDSELSEIFMRAFILRRVELIAHGLGNVIL